jgi:hypothetical protein
MKTRSPSSRGVVTLDFQNPGVISVVKVQPNQPVHKGQVLAIEYAPNVGALLTAGNAAWRREVDRGGRHSRPSRSSPPATKPPEPRWETIGRMSD